MGMRKRWATRPAAVLAGSIFTIGLALFSFLGAARAEHRALLSSQENASGFTLEGKISKVETGTFTVSTEENIIFHVRYGEKTEIKHPDGSAATSKEFRVGAHVKAEGEFTDSGEIDAKKIEIQPPADSKPPDSPK
ncbi:MAG TPA: DUF5666 domain-containing protein [Terriglobia bacterium]|nr:DUF5666 domain-containing protein [Terriglobia bacterium]